MRRQELGLLVVVVALLGSQAAFAQSCDPDSGCCFDQNGYTIFCCSSGHVLQGTLCVLNCPDGFHDNGSGEVCLPNEPPPDPGFQNPGVVYLLGQDIANVPDSPDPATYPKAPSFTVSPDVFARVMAERSDCYKSCGDECDPINWGPATPNRSRLWAHCMAKCTCKSSCCGETAPRTSAD